MAETEGRGMLSDGEAAGYLAGIIAFLFIIAILLDRLLALLGTLSLLDRFLIWIEPYLLILYAIAFAIIVPLVFAMVYLSRKSGEIVSKMRAEKYPNGEPKVDWFGDEESQENPKWKKVEEHIDSDNPSDWKLAIIEADIMLGELLEAQGYNGETIGDRLKQIEISDFRTLNEAWEAHKIRNQIAHEGSNFIISEREAKRIIGLFQKVFEEFKYI